MLELEQNSDGKELRLQLKGNWNQFAAEKVLGLLAAVDSGEQGRIVMDIGSAEYLDINTAWLIYKQAKSWKEQGADVRFERFPQEYLRFFDSQPLSEERPVKIGSLGNKIKTTTWDIGYQWSMFWDSFFSMVIFLGKTLTVLGHGLLHFRHLRIGSIFQQIFLTGINALPIIALLAALISLVLTYQAGAQLQQLGAKIYTVDLVAVSVLRELGVLLTAIMVAGRSSSAFAAEIGIMKVNQEIDAIKVAGLDPHELLVVPRLIALVISLPLLTLMTDLLALLMAALIADWSLDISLSLFAQRIQDNVHINTFLAGIIKAPFFAVVIAIVGTWNGMQVSGSSESLGQRTTAAVVESIFMVLLMDAVFSVFYFNIGF